VLPPLRQQLLTILRDKGLRTFDEPIQLASGEWSSDFIDGKEALADWADLELAGRAIVETVQAAGVEFDAVGGLTLGADALTIAVAAAANSRWFFIRKEAKGRGTRRFVEGAQIGPGDRVLLVDDVVTTGGSILLAHDRVVERGAHAVGAVTLVDRGELATPKFAQLGIPYFPMTTYQMLGIVPVGGGSRGDARTAR
jgi:orotate phosphoribosyltransferase